MSALFQVGIGIEGVGPIAVLLIGAGDGQLNLGPKPGVGIFFEQFLESRARHFGLAIGGIFAEEKQALFAEAADGEPVENLLGRRAGRFFVAEFGVGLHKLIQGDVK